MVGWFVYPGKQIVNQRLWVAVELKLANEDFVLHLL